MDDNYNVFKTNYQSRWLLIYLSMCPLLLNSTCGALRLGVNLYYNFDSPGFRWWVVLLYFGLVFLCIKWVHALKWVENPLWKLIRIKIISVNYLPVSYNLINKLIISGIYYMQSSPAPLILTVLLIGWKSFPFYSITHWMIK